MLLPKDTPDLCDPSRQPGVDGEARAAATPAARAQIVAAPSVEPARPAPKRVPLPKDAPDLRAPSRRPAVGGEAHAKAVPAAARAAASPGAAAAVRSREILRFRRSERLVHWAIAVPFLVCYTTATILVFVYNPDPSRPYRAVFSWIHRLSGLSFIVLPLLAVARCRGDFRIHFHNIGQAWRWSLDDVRWLFRMGFAMLNRNVSLPEQGKFNAGEKLNFMMVMTTYPLFVLTGILMWLPGIAFVSWVAHFFMALIATPFVFGHIFMATLNPSTRTGLQGMITGFVDRQWAKHHYQRWYRENFEGRGERRRP